MPKLTSYACDKCSKPTELDELSSVYVYCFGLDWLEDDPKIVELEYVCQPCREQFAEIAKGWAA